MPRRSRYGTGWRRLLIGLAAFCLVPVNIAPGQEMPLNRDRQLLKEIVKAAKDEVGIVLDQQMDFGQLADHDGSVVLNLYDTISSDPNFIHYGGSPYSGIHTITGDPDTAVDISISTTTVSGFTLSDFTSSEGDLPLIGVVLDGDGELVLTIGATLTIDADVAIVGAGQSIAYTITSTYN